MTKQTTTEDAIAAFLARGGKIRKVEGDATSGLSERDWADTVRGKVTDRNWHVAKVDENALIEQRHVTYDHLGREVVTNGLGERIA